MKKVLFILAVILAVGGCKKSEEVKTVSWYEEHNEERLAVLDKCKNNPGELAETPNCLNASVAKRKVADTDTDGHIHFKVAPPK